MNIFSCFDMWRSRPKFVRNFQLFSVHEIDRIIQNTTDRSANKRLCKSVIVCSHIGTNSETVRAYLLSTFSIRENESAWGNSTVILTDDVPRKQDALCSVSCL
jgi:hypothetical protein